jgi:glycosyltransferase involved in cell wall biosynthesis
MNLKLGFYYHVPVHLENNKLKISGLLGVFIDKLAKNCEKVYLILHEANEQEKNDCDYILTEKNIQWINLGFKNPAWSRDLFHSMLLSKFKFVFSELDALIVRSPTPYGPYFHNYIDKKKIIYMIVGDYGDSALNLKIRNFRDFLIQKYISRNNKKFIKVIKGANLLVNSSELLNKYQGLTNNILLIKTTTLKENDFFIRTDTCKNEKIKLLYTGRIDPAKGLFELIEALNFLYKDTLNKIELNIVGWDTDLKQRNLEELKKHIKKFNLTNYVHFFGKKQVGEELNYYYRNSDIYVFPSHFEGFPRTIWEAMANSLPIITTPVGGIPFVLTENKDAVFADVKNPNSLSDSIQKIINDESLRKNIIKNAYDLATKNTLDTQTKILIEGVKKFIKNNFKNYE